MQSFGKQKWQAPMVDMWPTLSAEKNYILHSKADHCAWSILYQMYLLDSSWVPPSAHMEVDYSHLFDDFPFTITFFVLIGEDEKL